MVMAGCWVSIVYISYTLYKYFVLCFIKVCISVYSKGDSAYPLHPFLLTPILNPTTPGENRYNMAHIRTRNIVEHTFGVLKSRFRCLDRTGGALLYSPRKVAQIVVVCCIVQHRITPRIGAGRQ